MSNPENSTLPPEKSGPPPEPVNFPELPQYSYYPPAPNPTINPPVYVNTPGATTVPGYRGQVPRYPCMMYCPNCKREVQTWIDYENNSTVWIFAIVLCLVSCVLAIIPFLLDSLKDVNHHCPYCRRIIATSQK